MWALARPDAIKILNDKLAKKALSRYFTVFQNKKPAKFIIAKKIPANLDDISDLNALWAQHKKLTDLYFSLEKEVDSNVVKIDQLETPQKNYLDLKTAIANKILQNCHFCVRRCGVNRASGQLGYCQTGKDFQLSTAFTHLGEEPELVPSGTIFSIGCNLKCLHCQNWTISQRYETGDIYTPQELAGVCENLRAEGCRNINMVGGSPTPHLHTWLDTFRHVKNSIATVWNSNSYYSEETAQLLTGFVDVFLLDYKYGSNECAKRISDAPNYVETCQRNHLLAKKYGELLIRILILPEHLDCCLKPICEWIAKNLGPETRVNLLFQYTPHWRADEIPELRRRLTSEEMRRSLEIAKDAGLVNLVRD